MMEVKGMKKVIATALAQQIEYFWETDTTIQLQISGKGMTIDRHKLPNEPVTKAVLAEVILHQYLKFDE